MSKYSELTDDQRELVCSLVDAAQQAGSRQFLVVFSSAPKAALISLDNQGFRQHVPTGPMRYQELAALGYIFADEPGSGHDLRFTIQQSAFDLAHYARCSLLTRRWQDLVHSLTEDTSLRSRVFWQFVPPLITGALGYWLGQLRP